jgi:hypothetical protein
MIDMVFMRSDQEFYPGIGERMKILGLLESKNRINGKIIPVLNYGITHHAMKA